jgi:hypothetical protein
MLDHITIPQQKIKSFCERHHIRRLALFGSVLHGALRADSDLDVLVEFEDGHVPGWEFVAMQDELSTIFGQSVDLNTPGFLSESFRDDVVTNAVVIYER